MLESMTPELHRQFELHYLYDMVQELRSMFEKQAGVKRFDLIQSFHAYKQEEGKSVADYVLKMKGYMEQLEYFVGFVRNYNMHNIGKTIGEIHAMLIEYEKGLPKKVETPQVMMIKSDCQKVKGSKLALPVLQGIRIERKLKQGALYLYVGNDVHAQVEAIRSFDLVLPNGLVICLDNCHYAPTITRGVVSVSCLVDNRFVQCFTDYGILVSKNGVLYFNVVPRNGINEIDMHDLVPNDYALESATRILNMVPTKKVDKIPYELWYAEFFKKCLISQEISGRAVDLEEIQEEEDTTPSEITTTSLKEVDGFLNHHR
ncbi:hypothetical protein Tco_0658081 [Tanacetum coccineum]